MVLENMSGEKLMELNELPWDIADDMDGAKRILGLWNYYKYSTGVYYPLMVFDTDLYREITGTWTAQSQSLTTNLEMGFVDAFDKVYMNNETDDTRIFDGSSVTTDANFKKGKIMAFFGNRIIVALDNDVWFTTLGTTTFSASQYINMQDTVTGLLAGDEYLYIFTAGDVYRIGSFENYEGQVYGPDAIEKMPCHVGTVAHRSIVKITHNIYTLTREGVYRIENQGQKATRISEDSETTFGNIDQDYLANASAVAFEDKYFLAVRETGQSYNNKILGYDTRQLHQSVFGTDESPTFLPAFTPYTYVGATLYPRVLAIIPTSTGKKRLMFGNELTGQIFQMETTDTADNSLPIISYMISILDC